MELIAEHLSLDGGEGASGVNKWVLRILHLVFTSTVLFGCGIMAIHINVRVIALRFCNVMRCVFIFLLNICHKHQSLFISGCYFYVAKICLFFFFYVFNDWLHALSHTHTNKLTNAFPCYIVVN